MAGNFDKNKAAREAHLKVILTLRKILNANKKAFDNDSGAIYERPNTYRNIYYKSDIREATISDTFNGKTVPNTPTLLLIIEAMGYNLIEFAEIYQNITPEEIAIADGKIDQRDYF